MSKDEWCASMELRSRMLSEKQRAEYVSKGSGPRGVAVEDRFAASFRREGECWVWQRRVGTSCLPTMTVQSHPVTSARWAWMEAHGVDLTPDDLVGSTCGTGPMCVNPQHHALVTRSEAQRHAQERRLPVTSG